MDIHVVSSFFPLFISIYYYIECWSVKIEIWGSKDLYILTDIAIFLKIL